MIITMKDGTKVEGPLSPYTVVGYIGTAFELHAKDVNYLVALFEKDPQQFIALLYQWQSRFPENRVGG